MPIIKFTGQILPKILKISLQNHPITWRALDNSLNADFNVQIKDSSVLIECNVNQYLPTKFNQLFCVAYDLARACIDLVAFSSAKSFSVDLDTFIDPNGKSSPILLEDPALTSLCTVYSLEDSNQNNLSEISKIIMTETPLQIALNELIMSLSDRHGAIARCARAVEGIKIMIAPPGTDSKIAWSCLRKNLCIEEGFLKFITDHSKAPRHGDRSFIPEKIIREVMRRAWMIMNRFLEFRKEGNVPLSQSRFPILK